MVIRKINSVFSRHGRVIFGVITLIIIVSFMGFMQRGASIFDLISNFGSSKAYGEIFEKKISREDVIAKANRNLILNDLIYNSGLNSYAASSQAEANAYINLCLLAAAERRGIDASDKEITNFIVERAKFLNPKTKLFDEKLYSNYIDNDLKANGFTADDLDNAVREYLIQRKLADELRDSAVVTADEVKHFYKLLNEKYYTSYAVFDKKAYLKKIKVDENEAKDYFATYTPSLADYIPGKSKVMLVKFKYSNPAFDEIVKKELTDKAVKDFYDNNKSLFMKFKSGEKPVAEPFDKVKEKAAKMLEQQFRKKLALQQAEKFAEAAYDAVGEAVEKKQRKVFEDLLAGFKYKAITTDWFSDDAEQIADMVEPALIREISSLREVPVSNAVAGNKAAYVALVTDRIESRPALFEEMKDKIIDMLKQQKAVKLARIQARELVAKLQKMDKAERLKAVTASKNPEFKIVKPFSLMSNPGIQYGNVISSQARELRDGEVGPVQNIPNGAIIVVMRKRVLPAMSGFDDKQKIMITNIYQRQKMAVAESAFMAWLQTKCKQNRDQ